MKPIDICFGMIRAGILIAVAVVLLAWIGPTVAATGQYLIGPRQLTCADYVVRVPIRWKAQMRRCDGEILVERRNNLLFDSDAGPDLMFVRSLAKRNVSLESREREFRDAYPGQTSSPMRVSDAFDRCFRVDREPNGAWISVLCMDSSRRLEFNFFGPEARLNQAIAFIEIRR